MKQNDIPVFAVMLGDCQHQNTMSTASMHLRIAEMHIKNGAFELARRQMSKAEMLSLSVESQLT
jgi:hypothetical protein